MTTSKRGQADNLRAAGVLPRTPETRCQWAKFAGIRTTIIAVGAAGLTSWPGSILADGGISALGGLLPIFIVLWAIGFGIMIWFFFSLFVLFAMAVSRKLMSSYQIYSIALIAVILCAAFISSSFLSILVLLAAFTVSIILGLITALVLWRAGKRVNAG